MNDVEDRLRATYERVASSTRAPQDRLGDVLAGGGRAHQPMLAGAGAFLATLLLVGGVVSMLPNRVVEPDASVGDDPIEAPTTRVAIPAGDIPAVRSSPGIAVDVEAMGLGVTGVAGFQDLSPATGTGATWLQAYRPSVMGFGDPSFWIYTDHDGSDSFRSGTLADEGAAVDLGGSRGYLLEDPMRFAFELGDRDTVVTAGGATLDELEQFVGGLTPTDAGWEASALPRGVVPVWEGPADPDFPNGLSSVAYQVETRSGQAAQVHLVVARGGWDLAERRVYSEVAQGSTVSWEEIGTKGVVVSRGGIGQRAVWAESDGVVALLSVDGDLDVTEVVRHVVIGESPWEIASAAAGDPVRTERGSGPVATNGTIDISDVPWGEGAAGVTEVAGSELPDIGRRYLYRWTETARNRECYGLAGGNPVCESVPASGWFPYGIAVSETCQPRVAVTFALWDLPEDVTAVRFAEPGGGFQRVEPAGWYAVGGWAANGYPAAITIERFNGAVEWYEPFRSSPAVCVGDEGPR